MLHFRAEKTLFSTKRDDSENGGDLVTARVSDINFHAT